MLYCTILYYSILYYTILYYTILYYTILYYTLLNYTMPKRSRTCHPEVRWAATATVVVGMKSLITLVELGTYISGI